MQNNSIRFACNGCGICCKGRLVPLTLNETRQWLERGHEVAIILEAFEQSIWTAGPQQFAHAAGRAVEVPCGNSHVRAVAVFAGNALVQCQSLGDDGCCGIYEERPLVCRIYPAEINPFIALDRENKICPPEVWEEGEVLFTDRIVDPVLADQIERSRQADREDAQAKIALCEALGSRKIPVGHFRRCSILALRAPASRIQPLAHMGLKTGSIDVLCTPA